MQKFTIFTVFLVIIVALGLAGAYRQGYLGKKSPQETPKETSNQITDQWVKDAEEKQPKAEEEPKVEPQEDAISQSKEEEQPVEEVGKAPEEEAKPTTNPDAYNPAAVKMMKDIALSYIEEEEYEQAVNLGEQVADLSLDDLGFFTKIIWIYVDKLQDSEKAVKLALLVKEANPSSAQALSMLGWAYLAAGQKTESFNALSEGINLDPKFASLYLNLGDYYRSAEKYDQAIENYHKAYQLDADGAMGKLASERILQLNQ